MAEIDRLEVPLGRIRVLADSLVNRIAAGEVVERPASIVKELVENSLDAGAGSIEVELQGGGRQRIEVRDDGCGMDRDDALLALERHATSKLSRLDELETIATLGFRGEALASIAAVSRLTLTTATEDGAGVELTVRGGRIETVREVPAARGTVVRVERVFFNVPARRKFLRSEATELSHALRWLTRLALLRHQVGFRARHGDRRLLDAAPVGRRSERLAQIFGREFAARLLPFREKRDGLIVEGLSGRPVDALPRRDGQYLFVNGRSVQDRVLSHAVARAYGNTVPAGRHPALFLFVETGGGGVDVNVHPQKTEVRFHDAARVHDLVAAAVHGALAADTAVPGLTDLRPPPEEGRRERVLAAVRGHFEAREPARAWSPAEPAKRTGAPGGPGTGTATPAGSACAVVGEGTAEVPACAPAVPLAQLRDSYILAEDRQGLVVVDQHAAHERVLFERYLAEAEENRVEVQRLLFPVTVDLAPHELAVLEREVDEFRRLGFLVEPFGGSTVRVDGVPAVAGDLDPESLLRELLGEARSSRAAASDVRGLRLKLVTTAACKAAIKVNHALSPPAMQALLDDLHATRNPTTCPHGRPVLFRLTIEEIERAFRRR